MEYQINTMPPNKISALKIVSSYMTNDIFKQFDVCYRTEAMDVCKKLFDDICKNNCAPLIIVENYLDRAQCRNVNENTWIERRVAESILQLMS